jgi:phosphatidylglycerol:prolipoprotein diacylglycerol transferase
MYPTIVRLGPITVYSFGVMMALAFVVSGLIVTRELDRRGMDAHLGSPLVFWGAIGGLLGARLWIIFDDLGAFVQAPLSFLLTGAGFVWYGGLLGGLLAVSLFIRFHRLPWLLTTDCLALAAPLGHAIGRIGCQLAGDGDWGRETTLPWGMAYTNAIIGWDYAPGVLVHPAPLYEAGLYTMIFAILWRLRLRVRGAGAILGTYFVLAGVARFGVEVIRIEPRVLFGLTEAQLFSAGLVAAGAVLVARARDASST